MLIVVTTLVIAALVGPLRTRLQQGVDRRFYRRKYDAGRTVAAFGVGLRNQDDLEGIGDQLLTAVDHTLQPSHVSLWLRPARNERVVGGTVLPQALTTDTKFDINAAGRLRT